MGHIFPLSHLLEDIVSSRPGGRGGETEDNEKWNNTLAKGVLQTTGSLDIGHFCAELVRGSMEAAGPLPWIL